LKCESCFANRTMTKDLADRTAQKQQQTWKSDNTVRYGSHQRVKVHRVDLEMCGVCKLGDVWSV